MEQIEKIIDIKKSKEDHRASLLSRIAASKLENPSKMINVTEVFHDYLSKIKKHFYAEKKKVINKNYKSMLAYAKGDTGNYNSEEIAQAKSTFSKLQEKYAYDQDTANRCLQFLLVNRPLEG